jgi:hypothetical protein
MLKGLQVEEARTLQPANLQPSNVKPTSFAKETQIPYSAFIIHHSI